MVPLDNFFFFLGWLVDITSGYNSMFYMATALKFCTAGCALALYVIVRPSPYKQCTKL